VEEYIAESVAHSNGDLELAEVKWRLLSEEYLLFVAFAESGAVRGAAVVSIYNRINDRVAYVVGIGGYLIVKRSLFSLFSTALKNLGATCIEGHVRDSLLRLYNRVGFEKKSTAIKLDI
jgi:hypothetical protein